MNQYSLVGGKSKGKTLAQVAKLHGMTADELRPQFVKGTKHELEHTNSSVIAKRIALDHLVEFADYYDRLDKVEKMKKGAVLETPVKFNDIVLYHEKKGSWLFAKGNFYAWLYDEKGVGEKIESGEYDFVMFPPMGKGSPFSDKYVPPLLMVWNKTYQKKFKGAEHLLGIVQGFYDEDTNEIFIDMMTTNPKYRRQGINAHIIKSLREEFGVSKENVIFEKPTKEGTKFMQSGKFLKGGETHRMHLGGDMSKHLAPNRKPSNLTHEQWHLVRTPEFKAWFGDWENDSENSSKVVDENGEPMVVYHGTKEKFNIFDLNEFGKTDKGFFGKGFYFTQHKGTAETYASISPWDDINDSYDAKGIVLSCFLNLKNPIIVQSKIDFINASGKREIREGYDGKIIIPNTLYSPNTEFIAFEPTQIKLADGTNTTFDGNNPDIRFAKGGLIAPNGKESNLTPEQYKLVRTKAFKDWFGDWENDPNDNMLIDENGEPMIWWHTGGDWTKLNDDGINGKGKLMFSPTERSMAYSRDGEQTITRPFFIKSDFIYVLPYEDRDKISAYRWNKNKKNPIWFVNAYGGFVVVRQSNQIKLADGTNTNFDSNNPDIGFAKGGRTIAQTPAPASDRKYGSKTNPKGSASDSQLAKSIKFNDKLEKAIENKVEAYNEKHRNDKVGLSTAKAVVRRGMGAYSKSHRPTISGGAPNSRQAWGLARLNKFLLKKSGEKVKSAYVQDDDLLKYANGGQLELEIKSNPYLKPTNCTDISDVDYALDSLRELDAKYGADNPKLLKIWEKMLERKKYLESKK